jgi:hypothetical protein
VWAPSANAGGAARSARASRAGPIADGTPVCTGHGGRRAPTCALSMCALCGSLSLRAESRSSCICKGPHKHAAGHEPRGRRDDAARSLRGVRATASLAASCLPRTRAGGSARALGEMEACAGLRSVNSEGRRLLHTVYALAASALPEARQRLEKPIERLDHRLRPEGRRRGAAWRGVAAWSHVACSVRCIGHTLCGCKSACRGLRRMRSGAFGDRVATHYSAHRTALQWGVSTAYSRTSRSVPHAARDARQRDAQALRSRDRRACALRPAPIVLPIATHRSGARM